MFSEIIEDIKSVKIQGAENVAKASIKAIYELTHKHAQGNHLLYNQALLAKKKLEEARPTEPCLRNTLKLLFLGVNEQNAREKFLENIQNAQNHFDDSKKDISAIGSRKITNGSVVFTHCHSSTVMDILKEAKKQNIRFEVKNTETRPLFQGRKTAIELSAAGIPVEHFVDSGAKIAIKRSDLVLLGADAITSDGRIINKIGSDMFAEIAKRHDIPVYVCTNSWKLDTETVFGFEEKIEKRFEDEIWKERPKGMKVSNYAFEKINPDLITGVISEVGVFKPEVFVEEVQRHYPWLFKDSKKRRILQPKGL